MRTKVFFLNHLSNKKGSIFLITTLLLSSFIAILIATTVGILQKLQVDQSRIYQMNELFISVETIVNLVRSGRGNYELSLVDSSVGCNTRVISGNNGISMHFCMDNLCLDGGRWCLDIATSEVLAEINPVDYFSKEVFAIYDKPNFLDRVLRWSWPKQANANWRQDSWPDPGGVLQNPIIDSPPYQWALSDPQRQCDSSYSDPNLRNICLRIHVCSHGTRCSKPYKQDIRLLRVSND